MSKNAIFHGKRHDNKILNVKILLSNNFVVMAQAPKIFPNSQGPMSQTNLQHCFGLEICTAVVDFRHLLERTIAEVREIRNATILRCKNF